MSVLVATTLRVNGCWSTETLRLKFLRPVARWRGHVVSNILLCAMAVNALATDIYPLCCHNLILRKDVLEAEEDKTCLMCIVLQVRKPLGSQM